MATVKPIPAALPAAIKENLPFGCGGSEIPKSEPIFVKRIIPIGLPITSPRKIPKAIFDSSAADIDWPVISTPAFARANKGTITKLDQVCNFDSTFSDCGAAKPRITPARVGWIPLR